MERRTIPAETRDAIARQIRNQLGQVDLITVGDSDIDKAWIELSLESPEGPAAIAYLTIRYGTRKQANVLFRDITARVRGNYL